MCSIRSVTRKPPTTFDAPNATPIVPSTVVTVPWSDPATRMAPTMTTPWMAFVPLMSGVCSVVGTFEMTSIPTNAASTNTVSSMSRLSFTLSPPGGAGSSRAPRA